MCWLSQTVVCIAALASWSGCVGSKGHRQICQVTVNMMQCITFYGLHPTSSGSLIVNKEEEDEEEGR